MGTRDLAERELIQGVIKLAAAFVHGARSNPAGIEKNLRGARDRVANGVSAGAGLGIDAEALLASIDRWLARPSPGPDDGDPAIDVPRVAADTTPSRVVLDDV
jgi:hypothetical protein